MKLMDYITAFRRAAHECEDMAPTWFRIAAQIVVFGLAVGLIGPIAMEFWRVVP